MQAIIFRESRHVRNLSRTQRPYQEELRSAWVPILHLRDSNPFLSPFALPTDTRSNFAEETGDPPKCSVFRTKERPRYIPFAANTSSVILARPFVSPAGARGPYPSD